MGQGNAIAHQTVCLCFRQYGLAVLLLSFVPVFLAGCQTAYLGESVFISRPSSATLLAIALREKSAWDDNSENRHSKNTQKHTVTNGVTPVQIDETKPLTKTEEKYLQKILDQAITPPPPKPNVSQIPSEPVPELREPELREKEEETVGQIAPLLEKPIDSIAIDIKSRTQPDPEPAVIEFRPPEVETNTSEVQLNPKPVSAELKMETIPKPQTNFKPIDVQVEIHEPKVIEEEFTTQQVSVSLNKPSPQPEPEEQDPTEVELNNSVVVRKNIFVLGGPDPDPERVEIEIYAPKIVEEIFTSQSISLHLDEPDPERDAPETSIYEIQFDNTVFVESTGTSAPDVLNVPNPDPETVVVEFILTPPDLDLIEVKAVMTIDTGAPSPNDEDHTDGGADSTVDDTPESLHEVSKDQTDKYGLGDAKDLLNSFLGGF